MNNSVIRNNEFVLHLESMIKLAQKGRDVRLDLTLDNQANESAYSCSFLMSEFHLKKLLEIIQPKTK